MESPLISKIADYVGGDVVAVFVDDARFVAGNDLSAGARAEPHPGRLAMTTCKVSVEPERIQDFDAEACFEAFEEWSGKAFAGGDGLTHAGEIEFRAMLALMSKERQVVARNRKEKRRPVALDVGVDALRGRAVGRENGGRTAGKRKVSGVPEAVGEEKTGDAVAAVGFVHPQNAFGVELRANDHVVMKVHAALGRAGAA